jgi:hypothetical protein
MKHWIAILAVGLSLLTIGCDTVNHSQLRVAPPPTERRVRAVLPAADRQTVKQILSEIGIKYRMEDRTALSLIPDTLVAYSELDKKNSMRFVAWVRDQNIYVDIFQRPPEVGETEIYWKLRADIMTALDSQFGSRLKMVPKMQQASGETPTK